MEGELKATSGTGTVTVGEKTTRYVVQRAILLDANEDGGYVFAAEPTGTWLDIGYVDVPVRSHRKSAVTAALERFKIPETSHPSSFRAIEEDIAEPIPVSVEQPPAPPARLKVGR